jgi:hypothetical protein
MGFLELRLEMFILKRVQYVTNRKEHEKKLRRQYNYKETATHANEKKEKQGCTRIYSRFHSL